MKTLRNIALASAAALALAAAAYAQEEKKPEPAAKPRGAERGAAQAQAKAADPEAKEHVEADVSTRNIAVTSAFTGTEIVVDSSKHPSLAFCLRTSDVDLRVVHVVRDIRGVAYSWSKTIR